MKTFQTKLSIKLNNGEYLDISAHIVLVISGTVERKACIFHSSETLDHLVRSLDMADTIPSENETSTVDQLMGNDYYLDINSTWSLSACIKIGLDTDRSYK